MNLLEYIKRNYETPNPYIIKDLGGSEELIEYLRNTPWNTNLNILGSFGSGGGGDAEVWLTSTEYQDQGGDRVFLLSGTEEHLTELFDNGENYQVFLNGEELPYYVFTPDETSPVATWFDAESLESVTKGVILTMSGGAITYPLAQYKDATTAPTSVEVSVKAK